jgi:hypothetical protein
MSESPLTGKSRPATEGEISEGLRLQRQRTERRRKIHEAALARLKAEGIDQENGRRQWASYFVHALALYEQEKDDDGRLGGKLRTLNDTWKVIQAHQFKRMRIGDVDRQLYYMMFGDRRILPPNKEPMELLVECIAAGYYPPPELLLVLWMTLNHFLENGADDPNFPSLESAFFGAVRRGKASYFRERRKKQERRREYDDFRQFIARAGADDKPFPTLSEAAEAFVDHRHMPISGRSFETRLRRAGGDKWMSALRSAIKTTLKLVARDATKKRGTL